MGKLRHSWVLQPRTLTAYDLEMQQAAFSWGNFFCLSHTFSNLGFVVLVFAFAFYLCGVARNQTLVTYMPGLCFFAEPHSYSRTYVVSWFLQCPKSHLWRSKGKTNTSLCISHSPTISHKLGPSYLWATSPAPPSQATYDLSVAGKKPLREQRVGLWLKPSACIWQR